MLKYHDLQRFSLAPGALSQNLVQVQSHGFLVDQAFYFVLQFVGEDPHQGLGGEPVLGALLVIALRHVFEEVVAGQVDVVDDLAQVLLEVSVSQVLQVVQSVLRNISLPLELAFAIFTDLPQRGILIHPSHESFGQFQVLSGGGHFAAGQSEGLPLLLRAAFLAKLALLTKVASEADQVKVLLDVVHDFGLEESLSGIVHNLVAELGLGNVFAELFDAGSLGSGSVFVDDLVAFAFGSLALASAGDGGHQFFDDLKLPRKRASLSLLSS